MDCAFFVFQRKQNQCSRRKGGGEEEEEELDIELDNCPSHTGSCMMNETPPNSAESYCSFVEQVREWNGMKVWMLLHF